MGVEDGPLDDHSPLQMTSCFALRTTRGVYQMDSTGHTPANGLDVSHRGWSPGSPSDSRSMVTWMAWSLGRRLSFISIGVNSTSLLRRYDHPLGTHPTYLRNHVMCSFVRVPPSRCVFPPMYRTRLQTSSWHWCQPLGGLARERKRSGFRGFPV